MRSCFRIPKEREEEEEEFRLFRKKGKERHFLKNGALLLEEMITSFDGVRSNPIRSFSKKELERVTNNYDQEGFLRNEFFCELYYGTYEDHAILVKKFTAHERSIEECINEVAVASQMSNHKNVLKLLGCCLETEIPTLVYEFAARGCLSNYIYEKELFPSKMYPIPSWESKLRIATEIADAVAYLHTGTSKPIIHRYIHSYNIFLDQNYVAKLFEFRHSISIPLGQTHVDADLLALFGYNAPESSSTRRFTVKSDVYSYGVVLFEILTGKEVRTILKEVYGVRVLDVVESNYWAPNSSSLLVDDNEEDIRMYLKANIVKGNTEQLMECVELAIRCIKTNPEERPTMMEAAKELRRITRFPK